MLRTLYLQFSRIFKIATNSRRLSPPQPNVYVSPSELFAFTKTDPNKTAKMLQSHLLTHKAYQNTSLCTRKKRNVFSPDSVTMFITRLHLAV